MRIRMAASPDNLDDNASTLGTAWMAYAGGKGRGGGGVASNYLRTS